MDANRIALVGTWLSAAASLGCGSPGHGPPRHTARCNGGPGDSALAVSVALDTVAKLMRFPSQVAHFGHDSTGFRIVTMPAQGPAVLDGMATVRLALSCQVQSVVESDSA